MNLKKYLILSLLFYTIFIFCDINDIAYAKVTEIKNNLHPNRNILNLEKYEVTIEAKKVDFIKDNLSGITYCEDTNTLFAITNSPRRVYELTKEGEYIRDIKLIGFKDTEGISYVSDGFFSIVDEQNGKMYLFKIDKDTKEVYENKIDTVLTLKINSFKNFGYEGVSYDKSSKTFYIVNEKFPTQLIRVSNLFNRKNLDISFDTGLTFFKNFMGDFSDIYYSDESSHLLFLSDESKMVVEVDTKNGAQINFLQLERGFMGLKRDIPQAEGITMDKNMELYIVSEPNLFYKFSKKSL